MAISSHYAQAYTQWNNSLCSAANGSQISLPEARTPAHTKPLYSNVNCWYQSGNSRCTYRDCTFTGSVKSVETHMMDRHLIFPPGWHSRPKKQEWDADPSLKGKTIPIQGTGLVLNDPDILERWMAERRNRFPTQSRVAEKQRKLEEAIQLGQLPFETQSSRKRRRIDDDGGKPNTRFQKGRGDNLKHNNKFEPRNSGPFPRRTQTHQARFTTQFKDSRVLPTTPAQNAPKAQESETSDSDATSDSEGPPEQVPSRPNRPTATESPDVPPEEQNEQAPRRDNRARVVRPPKAPKRQPVNPFAERPQLLRSLLLPEIRITVSNLSQAIRFLANNDFLRNVELQPGQAESKLIQVISET